MSRSRQLPGNIVLIGPMGVGKSTIGRHMAKILRKEFVDSDREIRKCTGASIDLIFDIEGEQGFRDREEKKIAELVDRQNIILATGGGAVLRESTRRHLRRCGTVVYLRATVDTQLERTRNTQNRPLLDTGDPRARLRSLMEVREPLYLETADIIINTDSQNAASVARAIIRKVEAKHSEQQTA